MRIVLDENVPRAVKRYFDPPHEIVTVQELAFSGRSNGELLAALDSQFDAFVTADRNLRYQQNLSGRTIRIVELPTNRLPVLRRLRVEIRDRTLTATEGEYVVIDYPA